MEVKLTHKTSLKVFDVSFQADYVIVKKRKVVSVSFFLELISLNLRYLIDYATVWIESDWNLHKS